MRFVDLFCGIGGFHAALHRQPTSASLPRTSTSTQRPCTRRTGAALTFTSTSGPCSMTSPRWTSSAQVFHANLSASRAPKKDSRSNAGTLFHDICTLAEKHKPAVLFLENVPNLVKHDEGNTMAVIQERFTELGYAHWHAILSPHKYGVPQVRTRVYIVAIRSDLAKNRVFQFPAEHPDVELDVREVLDETAHERYSLTEKETHWVNIWEDFLIHVNVDTKLPGHPIWADAFKGDAPLPGELSAYTKAQLYEIHEQWKGYGWVSPIKKSMRKDELIRAISLPGWKRFRSKEPALVRG